MDKDSREIIKVPVYGVGYGFAVKKLLDDKHGDPYVLISNAYLKRITEWPNIKNGDKALDRLATILGMCLNAMTSLSHLCILEYPQNFQMLISKLPIYLQDRWRREAVRIRASSVKVPGFKGSSNLSN